MDNQEFSKIYSKSFSNDGFERKKILLLISCLSDSIPVQKMPKDIEKRYQSSTASLHTCNLTCDKYK